MDFIEFFSTAPTHQYGSRDFLLQAGCVAKEVFYIEKGLLRIVYEMEEKEVTLQFFVEKQMVASFASFFSQQPSRFSIQALEPTQVRMLSFDEFQLMLQSQEVSKYVITKLLDRLNHYQNLFIDRISLSPEERYRQLLLNNSELLQRVPQHYLASYLGMTPVSLSRIRNRIVRK